MLVTAPQLLASRGVALRWLAEGRSNVASEDTSTADSNPVLPSQGAAVSPHRFDAACKQIDYASLRATALIAAEGRAASLLVIALLDLRGALLHQRLGRLFLDFLLALIAFTHRLPSQGAASRRGCMLKIIRTGCLDCALH